MLAPSLVHPARVAAPQAAPHTRCPGSRAALRRGAVCAALPTVFIDGEAGTTGLQVRERLAQRTDLQVVSIPDALRKDAGARKAALNAADAVILCLPDDAAVAAVQLLEPSNTRTVIIDASTAFRTADGWVYGFPELCAQQRSLIAGSKRISNPGCYPTGFVALTRPLVDAGLLPPGTGLTVHAVSGYSGGGKALIKVFEEGPHEPWGGYGYNLKHKHLPEMGKWSRLGKAPVFSPAVGDFAQGMVVTVPLHYSQLGHGSASGVGASLHAALAAHYAGSQFVSVMPLNDTQHLERGAFLRPDAVNGTNSLQLFVFADDAAGAAMLCARLDNLGKGASGAAVQNLNLALGLPEHAGLTQAPAPV